MDAGASWVEQLRTRIGDVEELGHLLGWSPAVADRLRAAARDFPLRTTRHYLSLVDGADAADPILLQILPDPREITPPTLLGRDPVGDLHPAHHRAPGLVHKYTGRALLVLTGACAVHCRYCFRRHFPYDEVGEGGSGWAQAIEHIRSDASIHEVILSGGDPLVLSDPTVERLITTLDAVPHLRRVRIHSRLPVVLPDRITPRLIAALAGSRLRAVVVAHFNHARELHPDAVAACGRLRAAGVPVLNQSVLLAGVNDDEGVLYALCEALADAGVLPYYLHLLDPVDGAAHFAVDERRAIALVEAVRARLPGWAVPRLVRDDGVGPSKVVLA